MKKLALVVLLALASLGVIAGATSLVHGGTVHASCGSSKC